MKRGFILIAALEQFSKTSFCLPDIPIGMSLTCGLCPLIPSWRGPSFLKYTTRFQNTLSVLLVLGN
jgi:hypothetical protein